MSIAERIREARKARKMTQGELGAATGLAVSTISGYEMGVREPNVHQINMLAKALNVSGDWLIESEWAYKAEEEKLTNFFRELNDDGKRAALATLEAYTKIEAYKKESSEQKGIG